MYLYTYMHAPRFPVHMVPELYLVQYTFEGYIAILRVIKGRVYSSLISDRDSWNVSVNQYWQLGV